LGFGFWIAEIKIQNPKSKIQNRDVLIMVALFLLGLVMSLAVAPLRLDMQDDGLYMHQANTLLRGGVPYRDYLLHDPPLGNAWHALMLSLFGNDVLVLRLAALPFKALLLPAVYALTRPLVPRSPALLAALVVPVTDTSSFYTVAHVAVNALGVGFVAVLFLMLWARHPEGTRRPVWLLAAGMALGVMAGFKQNMGLYLLAAAALWLIDPKSSSGLQVPGSEFKDNQKPETRNQKPSRWLLSAMWGTAVASVLWLVHQRVDFTVLVSLVLPVVALAVAALRSRDELDTPLRAVLLRWALLLAGFAATALPWFAWAILGAGWPAVVNGLFVVPSQLSEIWFAPLRPPVAEFWWLLGLYAAGILVAAAALALTRFWTLDFGFWTASRNNPKSKIQSPKSGLAWAVMLCWFAVLGLLTPLVQSTTTGLIYTWLYFNVLLFWPAFLLIERLPAGQMRTHARLLLLTAAFLALEMYPQLRRIQANWCLPLFLPLAAWVMWEATQALRRIASPAASRLTHAIPALAVALLPILAIWWVLDWRLSQFVDLPATLRTRQLALVSWKQLNLPHFHLWDTPDNYAFYHRIVGAITSRTTPGEPIYCFYRPVALYLATGRPPAVRNVYAPPETTVEDAEEMRDEIAQANVRIILVNDYALEPDGPRDVFFPARVVSWPLPIRDYIVSNYHEVEDFGEWSLWERNVR
jgi:hypothetical protein